ncbi:amidohydrolase family protein [Sphingosinicella sp. LHD-64]|uniref:N-acyl-D-amino-acid deacylase family protein n=1 Tax=Sphingosinicella sp. LHD-64 TaxID=3072139 RepID=UPI00280F6E65|nr:amidohydrolase family protein [Sphingosinicella sp. LHD-64]MDQ8757441.1 amidohydrolase family protein [Sphingosinicella sp. LHD-64]
MNALRSLLSFTVLLVATPALAQPLYDIVIRGGTVIDGTGRAGIRADVAIDQGVIVRIGTLPDATAHEVVDATGQVVAPGFLNIHSHARPDGVATAENMLTQGVTSEFVNADGGGTTDLTASLAQFATDGLALNIGGYVGFNAVWAEIVGLDDRRPSAIQTDRMRGVIIANLERGAWGVSGGLDYKPGYYASASEVARVISAARPWRTHFTNHDRLRPEENFSSYRGVAETIGISQAAGLLPVVTHVKSQGAEQRQASRLIALMDAATGRGNTTTTDVYPYLAGQSGLGALLLPAWALEGGRDAMLARFRDPTLRARASVEVEAPLRLRFGGADGVFDVNSRRTLVSWMEEWNVSAGEALIRLLEQSDRSAILRFGAEADLVAFLRYPASAIACDCGAAISRFGHPRYFGSFPRVLGHYVRETGVLTLEDAVRRMTGLPAQITGIIDRGLLAPGMAADIVVFDPATVTDHATFEQPTLPSTGIRTVLVNGVLALRDGAPTGAQGGQILLRRAYMPSRPMRPIGIGHMAGEGVIGTQESWAISFDVRQASGDSRASGSLRLRGPDGDWSASAFGILQTAPGWATVSAMVSDANGRTRPAILVSDTQDLRAAGGRRLFVRFGNAPLSGEARRLTLDAPH